VRPTQLQRVFASKWLIKIWLSATSVITVVFCLAASGFRVGHLTDWPLGCWYVFIGIVAGAFGFMLGVFPGVLLLGPLFHARGLSNGAPFHKGDTVHIITGPHRGTIAQVYSGWQGDSVRVELGAAAQKSYEDVFLPTELLRVTNTEPSASPSGDLAPQ
jgi:hypothetical protein